jgi:thiamine-phosphate pyrophosphorylase
MILLPRLYAIVDAAFFSAPKEVVPFCEELLAGGCTLVQYRNKSGNARVMLEQALLLRRRCRTGVSDPHVPKPHLPEPHVPEPHVPEPHVPKLIMNDRADLCMAAEFDGAHVGQDDLSPELVREIIGPERWLGVSTHNPEQIQQADRTSADYLAIGPVFSTLSKDKPDPAVGLDGVRLARQLTRKPLVAIGGITRANAASVIEAGADSVAVISDLLRGPRKSAEEFFRILR